MQLPNESEISSYFFIKLITKVKNSVVLQTLSLSVKYISLKNRSSTEYKHINIEKYPQGTQRLLINAHCQNCLVCAITKIFGMRRRRSI